MDAAISKVWSVVEKLSGENPQIDGECQRLISPCVAGGDGGGGEGILYMLSSIALEDWGALGEQGEWLSDSKIKHAVSSVSYGEAEKVKIEQLIGKARKVVKEKKKHTFVNNGSNSRTSSEELETQIEQFLQIVCSRGVKHEESEGHTLVLTASDGPYAKAAAGVGTENAWKVEKGDGDIDMITADAIDYRLGKYAVLALEKMVNRDGLRSYLSLTKDPDHIHDTKENRTNAISNYLRDKKKKRSLLVRSRKFLGLSGDIDDIIATSEGGKTRRPKHVTALVWTYVVSALAAGVTVALVNPGGRSKPYVQFLDGIGIVALLLISVSGLIKLVSTDSNVVRNLLFGTKIFNTPEDLMKFFDLTREQDLKIQMMHRKKKEPLLANINCGTIQPNAGSGKILSTAMPSVGDLKKAGAVVNREVYIGPNWRLAQLVVDGNNAYLIDSDKCFTQKRAIIDDEICVGSEIRR